MKRTRSLPGVCSAVVLFLSVGLGSLPFAVSQSMESEPRTDYVFRPLDQSSNSTGWGLRAVRPLSPTLELSYYDHTSTRIMLMDLNQSNATVRSGPVARGLDPPAVACPQVVRDGQRLNWLAPVPANNPLSPEPAWQLQHWTDWNQTDARTVGPLVAPCLFDSNVGADGRPSVIMAQPGSGVVPVPTGASGPAAALASVVQILSFDGTQWVERYSKPLLDKVTAVRLTPDAAYVAVQAQAQDGQLQVLKPWPGGEVRTAWRFGAGIDAIAAADDSRGPVLVNLGRGRCDQAKLGVYLGNPETSPALIWDVCNTPGRELYTSRFPHMDVVSLEGRAPWVALTDWAYPFQSVMVGTNTSSGWTFVSPAHIWLSDFPVLIPGQGASEIVYQKLAVDDESQQVESATVWLASLKPTNSPGGPEPSYPLSGAKTPALAFQLALCVIVLAATAVSRKRSRDV